MGLNVELATSDWGTVVTRRALKKPVSEGGWNVFGTDFEGAEMLNPWLNPPLPANGDKAWFGWPQDDKIEALRKEWLRASDSETRQEIAAKIQERAFVTVPYVPDRPIFAEDRLSQEPQGNHYRSGLVHVERREDLRPTSLASTENMVLLPRCDRLCAAV